MEYYSYINNIFFIYPSVDGHLGCFHILVIVNSALMNIRLHVSFPVMVFSRYLPRSTPTGSYATSVFNFLRNLLIVLYSGCTSLHSHKQCRMVPLSPPPLGDGKLCVMQPGWRENWRWALEGSGGQRVWEKNSIWGQLSRLYATWWQINDTVFLCVHVYMYAFLQALGPVFILNQTCAFFLVTKCTYSPS